MVHNILVFSYSSMMTYLSTYYHIYHTSLLNQQAGRIHLSLAANNNLFTFLLVSLF